MIRPGLIIGTYITIVARLWGSTDILSVGIEILIAAPFLNKEN
jgi:hypothetical protein